jgi:hypothetical protein
MTYSSYGWGYTEIPPLRVSSYLFIEKKRNLLNGTAIGVFSQPGKILSFRILFDNGAMVSKVPLNFIGEINCEPFYFPDEAQVWDCLSYGISCHILSHVEGCTVKVRHKSVKTEATYLFTLSFWGQGTYASKGVEIGYKDLHVCSTSNGLIAYPNTNIVWNEISHVTPFSWENAPKIETLQELPSCES